jgi:hypothetical protein
MLCSREMPPAAGMLPLRHLCRGIGSLPRDRGRAREERGVMYACVHCLAPPCRNPLAGRDGYGASTGRVEHTHARPDMGSRLIFLPVPVPVGKNPTRSRTRRVSGV